jgi:type IV pilus assembly protein PilC
METFLFKAIDLAGVPTRGELSADSADVVAGQLKARGLVVVDVAPKRHSREISLERFQRVRPNELAVMSRQLATMITSGMTLLRTLHVLEGQTESKLLASTLGQVRRDVESGASFSEAIARHPKVFSPLYVAMVQAGETGGLLEDSLRRVADQVERDAALRRKVKSAMIYPTVVITFALVVLFALVAFLVPVFANVFKEFGGDLPSLTKFTVGLSHFVTDSWWALFLIIAAVVGGFQYWRRSKWGRPQWDAFRLKIPLKIGEVVQKVAIARWARTLSSLTSAGVPILQAIDITGRTSGNIMVERAMGAVSESVKAGGTISTPLKQSPVFPPMVTHMIGVGEESGALDSMLGKVADFYEDEVDTAIKGLTSLMEPAMILIIGAIVGFIVVSMYLPLFKVYDNIR